MSESRYAKTFEDLLVYRRMAEIARSVFLVSRNFPREEAYSLTSQVRRSSRSVGAQIAEAWGKRRYRRHFISKLTDADAEQLETRHWVHVAATCGYLTPQQASDLINGLAEVGRMLQGMIRSADQFCLTDEPRVEEAPATYSATSHQ